MWFMPVLFWILTLYLLMRRGREFREAFLVSALAWGGLVVLFTESLSYLSLLTRGGLFFFWSLAVAIALLLHYRLRNPWRIKLCSSFTWMEKGLLGGVAFIAIATFMAAILVPPNDWDSMTYHMSRVMHWLQNRSVAHYPTHNLRQIDMNPWAEFAITQFQALSGGDRYANLVQWFSMIGSLVGVSLIAGQLGAGRRGQIFAVIVTATIPMGILQAANTQNDYVVSFWLVCLAWAGLNFVKEFNPRWALLVGLSLGLAVLSKGTAYLYALPMVIWIGLSIMKNGGKKAVVVAITCIIVPFFLLNSHHYLRNYQVFSNPLTSGFYKLANEEISPAILLSNLVRNIATEFSSPSKEINHLIFNSVAKFHGVANLDLNDPDSTWAKIQFKMNDSWRHDLFAGNILHSLLAFVTLACLLLYRSKRFERPALFYGLFVTAGFLLFCLLLKWQPWHNRLLLPLLVLGAPLVAVVAERFWQRRAVVWVALLLLTASLPYAVSNSARPLVVLNDEEGVQILSPVWTMDRNLLYFVRSPALYSEFVRIADDIRAKKVENVGLIMAWDDWEYPLWVLVNAGNPVPVHFEHLQVENASRFIETEARNSVYSIKMISSHSPIP